MISQHSKVVLGYVFGGLILISMMLFVGSFVEKFNHIEALKLLCFAFAIAFITMLVSDYIVRSSYRKSLACTRRAREAGMATMCLVNVKTKQTPRSNTYHPSPIHKRKPGNNVIVR